MALKPDVSAFGVSDSNSEATVPEEGGVDGVCGDDMSAKAGEGPEPADFCGKTITHNNDLDTTDMLPTSLSPTHYDIHLHPNIESGHVVGSVAIDAMLNERVERIVLHAKTIDIQSVTVYLQSAVVASVGPEAISYDAELETAVIELPSAIGGVADVPECAQLIIAFTGMVSDGMYGLYYSKCRDRSGEMSRMLVTQFQAKCARMVFPCWDEPATKAEFTLSLTVPTSFTALSNMPVAHTADHGALKTVYFERSPRMSTYLLAIVAGELDYIEAVSCSGPHTSSGERQPIVCRIYTPPADIDKVQFSLDTAVRVLERLVDMFDYAYPLPKLDLVAVPELEAGGMENWGLVLFRTVRLFITKQTSLWIRQKAVYVIAHELSHQWFGNLVTMAWWDDLWLNEGFATWIGIYMTDQLYPEWRRWDHFVIEDRQAALSADSLRSSHPIQVTIKGSADIDQVFDSITYYKGCSLIRMLSAHLGIDVFMAGVRAYLAKHAYSTATTSDLWQALECASGIDVACMMHSWTAHVGYPVITVDDSADDNVLQLHQHRYLHSGKPTPDEDRIVWWVPLGLMTSDSEATHEILHKRSGHVNVPASARWFKLNYDNAGLYRVCYSRTALQRLAVAIQQGELRTIDVVGVLNDTLALVTSGYLRTSALLDMLASFKTVDGYVVWQILGFFLENLFLTWADRSETIRDQIRELARSMFAPKAAALGWTHRVDEDPLVARLRTISIPRAAWAGDTSVIDQACRLFTEFYLNPDDKPFHHDFTASIFEIAVRNGDDINYARVCEMYEDSQRWHLSEDHRMAALGAMASSRNEKLMWQTLEYALSDHVLPQDINIVIGFMISSHYRSKHVLWKWFCINYQRVVDRLGECSALLGHVVGTVIGEFANEEMATEIEAWFADKRTTAFDRTLPQSLEFIRVRAAWYYRDKDDVSEWFSKYA
ncbi:Aminopeptidase 2 mitochondrial [Coemansia sp. RSA 2440]|nr:Aminopeptidase 2 mitochondrial [Coemansia sp. RSA 2440]